jgi:putative ABC transport system ATP-binding protein
LVSDWSSDVCSSDLDMGKTIIMVTHDPRAAARARILRHLDKGYLNDAVGQNPL